MLKGRLQDPHFPAMSPALCEHPTRIARLTDLNSPQSFPVGYLHMPGDSTLGHLRGWCQDPLRGYMDSTDTFVVRAGPQLYPIAKVDERLILLTDYFKSVGVSDRNLEAGASLSL